MPGKGEFTEVLTTEVEKETGISNETYVDKKKLRKLAYLTVIQAYLKEELEKSGNSKP